MKNSSRKAHLVSVRGCCLRGSWRATDMQMRQTAPSKAPQVFPPLSLSRHYIHFRAHRSATRTQHILEIRVRNWAVDWLKLAVFGNWARVQLAGQIAAAGALLIFPSPNAPLPIDEAIATLSIYSINARGSWPTSGGKLFLDASTHEGELLNISRKPHVAICGAVKNAICWLDSRRTHIIKLGWNWIQ
jgi:hypothetical protein